MSATLTNGPVFDYLLDRCHDMGAAIHGKRIQPIKHLNPTGWRLWVDLPSGRVKKQAETLELVAEQILAVIEEPS